MSSDPRARLGASSTTTSSSASTSTSTPGGSASSSAPIKQARRYGVACTTCRQRKVRCDGVEPVCKNCAKSGAECSYKRRETARRLAYLESQLAEADEFIKRLAVSDAEERDALLRERVRDGSVRPFARSDSSGQIEKRPSVAGSVHSLGSSHGADTEEDPVHAQVGLDEEGKVTYFGPTSRFFLTRIEDEDDEDDADAHSPLSRTTSGHSQESNLPLRDKESGFKKPGSLTPNAKGKKSLTPAGKRTYSNSSGGGLPNVNTSLQKSWEHLALANLQHDDVDPELSATLLSIFWTWQHPLHMCIYRPCFIRDMALGGQYFSAFLLNVLYAHAARHVHPSDPRFDEVGRGERFLARAKMLLTAETEQGRPKIATIQGLLILGGRQAAVGKSSEGWLYTGMAIRMMEDIGLHLDSRKIERFECLEPEDIEVRRRLLLSAYTWDKTLSFTLGRPPTVRRIPFGVESIVDFTDDDEEWRPKCLGDKERTYPPFKSYSTRTFCHFFLLATISNDIFLLIYNSATKGPLHPQVTALETRLREWYAALPPVIKLTSPATMTHCPPPHVASLNLYYHTVLTILYRPFFRDRALPGDALGARARDVCLAATATVHDIFLLYGRAFDYQRMTYLVSYCMYTATTINVLEVKMSGASAAAGAGEEEQARAEAAAQRLMVSLKVLEMEATLTPGIRRSIEIIRRQLRTLSAVSPFEKSVKESSAALVSAAVAVEKTREEARGGRRGSAAVVTVPPTLTPAPQPAYAFAPQQQQQQQTLAHVPLMAPQHHPHQPPPPPTAFQPFTPSPTPDGVYSGGGAEFAGMGVGVGDMDIGMLDTSGGFYPHSLNWWLGEGEGVADAGFGGVGGTVGGGGGGGGRYEGVGGQWSESLFGGGRGGEEGGGGDGGGGGRMWLG